MLICEIMSCFSILNHSPLPFLQNRWSIALVSQERLQSYLERNRRGSLQSFPDPARYYFGVSFHLHLRFLWWCHRFFHVYPHFPHKWVSLSLNLCQTLSCFALVKIFKRIKVAFDYARHSVRDRWIRAIRGELWKQGLISRFDGQIHLRSLIDLGTQPG